MAGNLYNKCRGNVNNLLKSINVNDDSKNEYLETSIRIVIIVNGKYQPR